VLLVSPFRRFSKQQTLFIGPAYGCCVCANWNLFKYVFLARAASRLSPFFSCFLGPRLWVYPRLMFSFFPLFFTSNPHTSAPGASIFIACHSQLPRPFQQSPVYARQHFYCSLLNTCYTIFGLGPGQRN